MEKEVQLQQKAGHGVAPEIHGVAHRVNKRGQSQSIIFMDIEGISAGGKMRRTMRMFGKHCPKLALLLLQQVATSIKNGVYPTDLRWENVLINIDETKLYPKDGRSYQRYQPQGNYFEDNECNLKLIDFGKAEKSNKMTALPFLPESLATPPELITDRGEVNAEKATVWQLGVMILDLFWNPRSGESEFFSEDIRWDCENKQRNIELLNKTFEESTATGSFSHFEKEFETYVPILKQMLSYDPQNRISIQDAIKSFESKIAE